MVEVAASLPAASPFLLRPSLPGHAQPRGSGQEWAVTNPCLLLPTWCCRLGALDVGLAP